MCSSQPFIRLCTSRHNNPPTNQSSIISAPLQNQASCLRLPCPRPSLAFDRMFTISQLKDLNLYSHSGQRFPTTALPSPPANHHTTVPIDIIQWSIPNITHGKSNPSNDTLLPFQSPAANQENLTLEFHTHFAE